jgi:hypothetical protein
MQGDNLAAVWEWQPLAHVWALVGQDRVFNIATHYGLDSPGIEFQWGAWFSASIHISSGAHPAAYSVGTRSLPGVVQPGHGIDHPTPSSAEV